MITTRIARLAYDETVIPAVVVTRVTAWRRLGWFIRSEAGPMYVDVYAVRPNREELEGDSIYAVGL